MAFLHRTYQAMPSHAKGVCLDFFFYGAGTVLQRTRLGMFRCLLYQLYRQSISARRLILTVFQEKERGFGEFGKNWQWSADELAKLFEDAIVTQPAKAREITIFIDALDEAADERSSNTALGLINYFHQLTDRVEMIGGKTRICVSCRHYPVVAANLGMQIYVENENAKDIASFVRYQLHSGVEDWTSYPEHERKVLEEALIEKTNGVFLWARLRLQKLVGHLNDGLYSLADLQTLLGSESNELSATYESILVKEINPALRDEALLFLQWVCLAERPLSLAEIRCAMACDERVMVVDQKKCEESERFVESDARMQKLTKSLSGGLAEVVGGGEGKTVQLFHSTVNEYLRDHGLQLLSSLVVSHQSVEGHATRASIGASHYRLSQSCFNYLKLEDFFQRATEDFQRAWTDLPFARYATKNWLIHAERAERNGIDQAGTWNLLLTQPRVIEIWQDMYFAMDKGDPKCPPRDDVDPVFLAITWNLETVVVKLLANIPNLVRETDYDDSTALHYAARLGHENIATMLLEYGADIEAVNRASSTPLQLAAVNGHERLVGLFVKKGADINRRTGFYGNALISAAESGKTALAAILLQNGADVNSRCGYHGNALKQAAWESDIDMVSLILSYRVDVNDEGGCYGTALHTAIIGRQTKHRHKIVQLLLDAGADPNIRGCDLGNAFQAAAKDRNFELVKLFLAHGADINSCGGRYGSALHASASQGSEDIAQFLVEEGADVNVQGGEYGNALQAAALNGSTQLVNLLLANGAQINATGGKYGSALQAAAASYGQEVFDILLEAGAISNIRGGYYGNLLQAALSSCNYALARRLLLEDKSILNEQGGHFGSALQSSIVDCKLPFIELLLKNGADPNIGGGDYHTPLQAAVVLQKYEVVKLLIEYGADINFVASDGTFALQTAARHHRDSQRSIVRLLLDAGAEVDLYGGGQRSTALYEAISAGQKDNVVALLERGARTDIRAGFWGSVYEAAADNRNMLSFVSRYLERTNKRD